MPSGTNPSSHFQPVAPGSLGAGTDPPTIYVVAHGWAPGYRPVVDANGGNLLWWGSGASSNKVWASDWAWSPVSVANPPVTINATGVVQSIVAFDPNAVVLAYSWIDDSATDAGYTNLVDVYQSEAYTHVNGIRLANALQEAIAPSFWDMPGGLVRIIGHSHGSKVATVAALTLQQLGRRVAHLTICDAPESETTLEVNGANLLGFYLEQLQVANPSYDCAGGAFVDNYASYFGVGYAGSPNLAGVVEVALDPSKLYGLTDASDRHTYAATWYGGAASGAASTAEPPLGFAWPPPPTTYQPALNQTWPNGTTAPSQWQLRAGTSIHDTFSYSTQALSVGTSLIRGNVQGEPSTRLVFGPTVGAAPSTFKGYYTNSAFGDGYGVAVDIVWTAPQAGDYLVIAMEAPVTHDQETLLVLDGQSSPAGKTSVAINSVATSGIFSVYLWIYFIAADGNTIGQVAISNFRLVEVGSASGYLKARRQAIAANTAALRASRAPNLSSLPATGS